MSRTGCSGCRRMRSECIWRQSRVQSPHDDWQVDWRSDRLCALRRKSTLAEVFRLIAWKYLSLFILSSCNIEKIDIWKETWNKKGLREGIRCCWKRVYVVSYSFFFTFLHFSVRGLTSPYVVSLCNQTLNSVCPQSDSGTSDLSTIFQPNQVRNLLLKCSNFIECNLFP